MKRLGVGIAGLLLVVAAGCARGAPEEQIRLDAPTESQYIDNVDRLTDGQQALEGTPWQSEAAASFRRGHAFAMFDLGKVTPIEAAYLQGDNNDEFIIEVSEDGTHFTTLWAGLVTRPSTSGVRRAIRLRWARPSSVR